MKRSLLFLTLAALPAFANITYECASNVDVATCNALNGAQVSGVYASLFSNVNADIYVQSQPGGPYGESSANLTQVPYSQYYAALGSLTDDQAAFNSLPVPTAGNPLSQYDSTENIDITPALASSLGLPGADNGLTSSGGSCTLTLVVGSGCYSGVITFSSSYTYTYPTSPSDLLSGLDFYGIIEHETDEILGTISCIGTQSTNVAEDQCNPGGNDASPADLFRYGSAGTPSFLNSDNGTTAYFSIDGGVTPIAYYNNTPNYDDFGDWTGSGLVQDAEASNGTLDISTDPGLPEVAVLDAVGFDTVPEQGTLGMLGASLGILVFAGLRRRGLRRAAAWSLRS